MIPRMPTQSSCPGGFPENAVGALAVAQALDQLRRPSWVVLRLNDGAIGFRGSWVVEIRFPW